MRLGGEPGRAAVDELVAAARSDRAIEELLGGLVVHCHVRAASGINNAGPEGQVRFLVDELGEQPLLDWVAEAHPVESSRGEARA